jgi:ABC-type multidrug transport system fused ATPase/permease subunit
MEWNPFAGVVPMIRFLRGERATASKLTVHDELSMANCHYILDRYLQSVTQPTIYSFFLCSPLWQTIILAAVLTLASWGSLIATSFYFIPSALSASSRTLSLGLWTAASVGVGLWLYFDHLSMDLIARLEIRVRSSMTSVLLSYTLSKRVPFARADFLFQLSNLDSFADVGMIPKGFALAAVLLASWALLFIELGWASIPADVLTIACYSISSFVISKLRLNRQTLVRKLRAQSNVVLSELISSLELLKMMSWEQAWLKRCMRVRRDIQAQVAVLAWVDGADTAVRSTQTYFGIVLTLALYSLNAPLTPAKLAITGLLSITNAQCCIFLVSLYSVSYPALVSSVLPVLQFLSTLAKSPPLSLPSASQMSSPFAVELEKASITWPGSDNPTLRDISLRIPRGALVAVVGEVGTGKTTLLKALLGELAIAGGCSVNGTVSYSPQLPWLFPNTIRENILLGSGPPSEKYQKILNASCLVHDLSTFQDGDMLQVSSQRSLSGGQCARVNIARALCRDADIYLFDDPLSSLDPRTASLVFANALVTELSGKTRLVILSQHAYIEECEYVLYVGKNSEVRLTAQQPAKRSGIQPAAAAAAAAESKTAASNPGIPPAASRPEAAHHSFISTFIRYLTARSALSWFGPAITTGAAVASSVLYFYSLSAWVLQTGLLPSYQYPVLSASLAVCLALLHVLRVIHFRGSGFSVGSYIILQCIKYLGGSPLYQCRKLSEGRLRQLLSTLTLEGALPTALSSACFFGMGLLGSFIMMLIANVYLALVLFWWVLLLLCASKLSQVLGDADVAKTENELAGSLADLAGPLYDGRSIAQAFGAQPFLISLAANYSDMRGSALLLERACQEFISWIINASYVGTILVLSLSLVVSGASSSLIAVIIMPFINVGVYATAFVHACHSLRPRCTEVHPLIWYNETWPLERLKSTEAPPADWPSQSKVSVEHLSAAYSPGADAVIRDVSMSAAPMRSLAVLGRTGSGKSSTLLAMMRLIVILVGRIDVDGVDILTLIPKLARTIFAVVPQRPVIFTGGGRFNLDPFARCSESDIQSTLAVCLLADVPAVASSSPKIPALSAGQQQLLMLARALLCRPSILLLDEATSTLDSRTDGHITQLLHRLASKLTIISVVHRVENLRRYHNAVLLQGGAVLERGTIEELLESQTSQLLHHVGKD